MVANEETTQPASKKQKISDSPGNSNVATNNVTIPGASTSGLNHVKIFNTRRGRPHRHHRRPHQRPPPSSSGQPTEGQPTQPKTSSNLVSEHPRLEQLLNNMPANLSIPNLNLSNPGPSSSSSNQQSTSLQSQSSSSSNTIKPYWCRFEGCARSFTAPAHLKEHENIHLGVRPYLCKWPDCGYDSTQRNNVITHIRGKHFNLPPTIKEQRERNIRDNRDPSKFLEVRTELLR